VIGVGRKKFDSGALKAYLRRTEDWTSSAGTGTVRKQEIAGGIG